MWLATQNNTNRNSTVGIILFPSLSNHNEGLLVGNMYTCRMWIPLLAGHRHTDPLVIASGSTGLPSCWHLDVQTSEAASPLQLLVQTASLCIHTHTQWILPVTGLRHPVCLVAGLGSRISPLCSAQVDTRTCTRRDTCSRVSFDSQTLQSLRQLAWTF